MRMRIEEGMVGVCGRVEVEALMGWTVGSIGVARERFEEVQAQRQGTDTGT